MSSSGSGGGTHTPLTRSPKILSAPRTWGDPRDQPPDVRGWGEGGVSQVSRGVRADPLLVSPPRKGQSSWPTTRCWRGSPQGASGGTPSSWPPPSACSGSAPGGSCCPSPSRCHPCVPPAPPPCPHVPVSPCPRVPTCCSSVAHRVSVSHCPGASCPCVPTALSLCPHVPLSLSRISTSPWPCGPLSPCPSCLPMSPWPIVPPLLVLMSPWCRHGVLLSSCVPLSPLAPRVPMPPVSVCPHGVPLSR